MSKDRSQKYPPLALPAKSGKAKGWFFLPSSKVGAYCIRPLALPTKDGKAEGLIPLPSGKVGAYCIRPYLAGQGQESQRMVLSDSCRLRVWGYIFESQPFRGRESPRGDPSSFRQGRGVLHTPPRPPRQGRESPRGALSDSCRLRVCGYIFESQPFRGRESGADRPSINQREYLGVTTHEGRTDGSAHCTPIRDRYTLRGRRIGSPLSNQCYLFNSWSMFST